MILFISTFSKTYRVALIALNATRGLKKFATRGSGYTQLIAQTRVNRLGSLTLVQTVYTVEIVMNELRRFKHSADFLVNSSHITESAVISAS